MCAALVDKRAAFKKIMYCASGLFSVVKCNLFIVKSVLSKWPKTYNVKMRMNWCSDETW